MAAKILITGAAGFIGSHLAERLLSAGHDLVLVDDLSSGRQRNIEHLLNERCRLVHARISEACADDPKLFEGVDRVYHLAASVGVRTAIERPLETIQNNVNQTQVVLEHAARVGASVLITSSSEVYGKSDQIPMTEQADIVFGPTSSPRWSYAMSKALDEQLALAFHRQRDLAVVIVRLFNMIGPRQVGRYGMVVPRFVHWAVSGHDVQIHGDGTQTRTFCDVRDATESLVQLLDRSDHAGRVFNIGGTAEISINALADLVIELSHGNSCKRWVPYDQAYEVDYEDPSRRVPDLSAIEGAIGFQPRYTLRQTLTELIETERCIELVEQASKLA